VITLRLKKAQVQWLREYTESVAHNDRRAAEILGLLERAELLAGNKKPAGIGVAAAIDAFRGVLGPRLVLPPRPGPSWFAPLARRLGDMGVTVDDCKRAAEVAAERWRGAIKAESIIRQCDVLLSAEVTESGRSETPIEMEGYD
jgi:predicted NBD/HSP70 family sugar kinase